MQDPEDIVTDRARVTTALADLGLTDQILTGAVAAGITEASRTTLNDPKTAFGYIFWQSAVRFIRESLTSDGNDWERRDRRGFPTILNPRREIAIGVSSGDASVGLPDKEPRTRNSKGPEIEAIIMRNQLSFHDAFVLPEDDLLRPVVQPKETYLLLYFYDELKHETRSELALPIRMDQDGLITGWKRRLILEAIPHQPAPKTDREDDENYNPDVKPKTG